MTSQAGWFVPYDKDNLARIGVYKKPRVGCQNCSLIQCEGSQGIFDSKYKAEKPIGRRSLRFCSHGKVFLSAVFQTFEKLQLLLVKYITFDKVVISNKAKGMQPLWPI